MSEAAVMEKLPVDPPLQEVETPKTLPSNVTPMTVLSLAIDQGADLDRIERLMDLQDRWEEKEAKKAFTEAMANFKAEAPELYKNKTVGYESKNGGAVGYSHATLDHICDRVNPVLAKHGLSYHWVPEQNGEAIKVTCVLSHKLGHKEEVFLHAGKDNTGNKNVIQQVGSTISYLERYTLLASLGMATKEQDNDGNGFGGSGGAINDIQKNEIVDLLKSTGSSTVDFLKFMKAKSVDEIPVVEFDKAIRALKQKGNTNARS